MVMYGATIWIMDMDRIGGERVEWSGVQEREREREREGGRDRKEVVRGELGVYNSIYLIRVRVRVRVRVRTGLCLCLCLRVLVSFDTCV